MVEKIMSMSDTIMYKQNFFINRNNAINRNNYNIFVWLLFVLHELFTN